MSKRDAEKADLDENVLDLHQDVFDLLQQLYDSTPVNDGDITKRTLSMLSDFDLDTQKRILEEYKESNFDVIRSKDAYLRGTIRKRRKVAGGYTGFGRNILAAIDRMYDNRVVKLGDLDSRCFDALRSLDESTGQRVIQRFTKNKLEKDKDQGVQNLSAFFMSQIKQTEKEQKGQNPFALATQTAFPQAFGALQMLTPAIGTLGAGLSPLGAQPLGMASMGGISVFGRQNFSFEQAQMGVRLAEFHGLSQFAPFVHPAAALKLQQLWDRGVKLTSLLEPQSWEALTLLDGPSALLVVDDTANMLESGELRNANGYLMSKARPLSGGLLPEPSYRLQNGAQRGRSARGRGRGRGRGGGRHEQEGKNSYSQQSYLEQQPQIVGYEQKKGESHKSDQFFSNLPSGIKDRAASVIEKKSQFLSEDNFDSSVVQALSALPEDKALQVLGQLEERDLSNVRNISGYILGICRNAQK